jgi:hypothetical protein
VAGPGKPAFPNAVGHKRQVRTIWHWYDLPLRVHSPIDVRGRLLGGSEDLGVFVSAAIVELGDGLGDFRRRARFFSDSLAPLKASELLAGMVGMMRDQMAGITTVDQAQAFLAQQAGADILLSNLGAVDFPDRYGPFTLEALWGPSVTLGFALAQTIGDTGGEVVFQRICAPMGRMISSIQYPFRCPCEPIDVAPSGRPDLAA